jgi:Cupin domain
MPKASRQTMEITREGPVEDYHADLPGGYTVNFTTFLVDIDDTEMMRGLPGDQCPCSRFGYVLKGQLTFRTDDGEEVYGPGDAFYLPPGHIPIAAPGPSTSSSARPRSCTWSRPICWPRPGRWPPVSPSLGPLWMVAGGQCQACS